MLSLQTKVARANERLKVLGAKFDFGCGALKTYTPNLNYFVRPSKLVCSVENKGGFAFFYIHSISVYNNYNADPSKFTEYIEDLKKVQAIMDYCNSLNIEVSMYESG